MERDPFASRPPQPGKFRPKDQVKLDLTSRNVLAPELDRLRLVTDDPGICQVERVDLVDGRELLRLVNTGGQVFVVSSVMAEKVTERVADSLFPPTIPLSGLKDQRVTLTETSTLTKDPFFDEPPSVVRIVSGRATLKSPTGQVKMGISLSELKRYRGDGIRAARSQVASLVHGPLGGAIGALAERRLVVGGVALKTRT